MVDFTPLCTLHIHRLPIHSPCKCEPTNPDSLDARLFPSVVLAVAPAVTMDGASSLSLFVYHEHTSTHTQRADPRGMPPCINLLIFSQIESLEKSLLKSGCVEWLTSLLRCEALHAGMDASSVEDLVRAYRYIRMPHTRVQPPVSNPNRG